MACKKSKRKEKKPTIAESFLFEAMKIEHVSKKDVKIDYIFDQLEIYQGSHIRFIVDVITIESVGKTILEIAIV